MTDIDEYNSPTYGKLSFDQVFERLVEYVNEDKEQNYHLIVGTDSLLGKDTSFVTAIVVHRLGKGGRYFYRRQKDRHFDSLRQRITLETALSLDIASKLSAKLAENGNSDLPIEIHLDVGEVGDTRKIIKEVVGMVVGSGYKAVTKPDSYGASTIADKHV